MTSLARARVADGVNLYANGDSDEKGRVTIASAANTDVSVKADGSTVDRTKQGVGVASAVALNKVTSTNEAYLEAGTMMPVLQLRPRLSRSKPVE